MNKTLYEFHEHKVRAEEEIMDIIRKLEQQNDITVNSANISWIVRDSEIDHENPCLPVKRNEKNKTIFLGIKS